MDLTFANPAGLFALLGLPAVLAIHFFQRKTKRVEISTLFLLEELTRESVKGPVWERIRNSPLLWLQLLAVLLLTWLLVQPRWLRPESVQQTIIVLDSSVSLRPFLPELRAQLRAEVNRLGGVAARSEWTVIESDTTRGTVYSGGDAGALLAALAAWSPRSGHHDILPALQLARDLQRRNGVIVFASDRRPEGLPAGVELVAVGHGLENCGFAGARVDVVSNVTVWSALLMNHGKTAQSRRYHLEFVRTRTPDEPVTLEPGGIRAIRGEWPRGVEQCRLVLNPDAFALDDTMPLVLPQPKRLTAIWSAPAALQGFVEKIARSLDGVEPDTGGRPDFAIAMLAATASGLPTDRSGIFLLHDEQGGDRLRSGVIVPDRHPIMSGLSWQGLLARTGSALATTNSDRTLLWQGAAPLIFLRESGRTRQLVFNFDVAHANLDRLPAFVLLVRRFVETLRAEKVELEARNVELNQPLEIAARLSDEPAGLWNLGVSPSQEGGGGTPPLHATVLPPGLASLRAPDEPCFFEIRQGTRRLFEGAAHFADTREADFKLAASENTIAPRARELTIRNSRRDMLTPLWLVLLAGTLLASWAVAEGRRRPG